MTRRRRIAAGLALALTTIASCTSSDDGGGGNGDSNDCPEASEGCPCLDGMCVGTLRCLSNRCVDDSASGGTGATGGTTGGGAGSNSGGMSGTAAGGTAGSGQGGGAGGATGGSTQAGNGGSSGASGAAGAGGMSGMGGTSGSAGAGPLWSPCFREADFATCDAACASIAATCVAEGCSMVTWYAWGEGAPERCETMESIQGFGLEACNVPLNWSAGNYVRRCCCGTT